MPAIRASKKNAYETAVRGRRHANKHSREWCFSPSSRYFFHRHPHDSYYRRTRSKLKQRDQIDHERDNTCFPPAARRQLCLSRASSSVAHPFVRRTPVVRPRRGDVCLHGSLPKICLCRCPFLFSYLAVLLCTL